MNYRSNKASDEIVETLKKQTHFSKDEIERLYNLFKKLTSSNEFYSGIQIFPQSYYIEINNSVGMERIMFKEILHDVFHILTEDILIDRIFSAFDKRSDGIILVDEWILGLSVFLRGTLEEKISFAFFVYDLNLDGLITKDEIFILLRNCLIKLPQDDDPDESIKDLVDITLKKLDWDRDGKISYQDFRKAVNEDNLLLEALGQCLPGDDIYVVLVKVRTNKCYEMISTGNTDATYSSKMKRTFQNHEDGIKKDKLRNRRTSPYGMLFFVIAVLYELLYLILQFIVTTMESWYLTLFPKKMKSLAGEIILVTGAGHGIGRETCYLYAAEKAILVLWDIDEKGITETRKLLEDRGYNDVFIYKVDVSDRNDVLENAEKVKKEVGDVTILVNNAGILPCRPLKDHSPELIEKIFKVNVFAHFWTLEAFLPDMLEKNRGHVVAMSSFCGILGLANAVPYCASKFAVRGLMEALSEEIRCGDGNKKEKCRIKFTTIYPIMVNTGLVKNPRNRFPFLLDLLPPEKVASIIVKSIRREYKEVSIPRAMLTMDRLSRLIPEKFNHYVRDFLDTGLDPDN
ncbi:hypothetical protein PGB90_005396 [Kerria lacca]